MVGLPKRQEIKIKYYPIIFHVFLMFSSDSVETLEYLCKEKFWEKFQIYKHHNSNMAEHGVSISALIPI
jgi:hypothetical protein